MMKFFAEVVNVFLLFPQRSSAIAVRHNPKICLFYFPYNFYCSTLHCLKQTCQIFKTVIFQDVSEDLMLSYDLISLFPSIQIFFTALYMDLTIITSFVENLKIS